MSKRKICVVTGTRAEYGLLYWLMKEIAAAPDLELQLVATGMHLAPEFGLTYRCIEQDGFRIDAKVEMLLSSDTPVGVAKSLGLGVIGFADALERLAPDLLVLLGDRFEILAAAQAALIAKLPVAHIAGGDSTEGAFDEAIRHSISKMSHLHFVTNEEAAQRVRQLGENPRHVFNFGSPGIDGIKRLELLGREELAALLEFPFLPRNILVTYHPVTLESGSSASSFGELLAALERLGPQVGIIFTKPNADPEGRELIRMLEGFVAEHGNARAYASLGQLKYLSLVRQVDLVAGNSSSGLYEVPSFKKPTVNIGERQKGRPAAASVLNCGTSCDEIYRAIQAAFAKDCSAAVNPYGDGDSAARMVAALRGIADYRALLKKQFFRVEAP